MFISRKKIFAFLLLVSLLFLEITQDFLFTNSFILAYDMPGDVWSFITAPAKTPTPPAPPADPPAPPADPPAPPFQGGGSLKSQTMPGDVWSFTTREGPTGTGLQIKYQIYCKPDASAGQGIIGFEWIYFNNYGEHETGYDFMINDINDENATYTAEVFRQVRGLDVLPNATQTQAVYVEDPLKTDKIEFNKTYYWWVKVYIEGGGKNTSWTAGPSFVATPVHAYPYPDFVVSPTKPVIDKTVEFKQDSAETGATCYKAGGEEKLCQDSSISAIYNWDFEYPSGIDSFLKGNATTSYNATGTYDVMLRIKDELNVFCTTTKSITVYATTTSEFSLPKWREISP
jgi:hypothetical protein